jgi:3-oxoacyl-[acyl-carrier protein] reductase
MLTELQVAAEQDVKTMEIEMVDPRKVVLITNFTDYAGPPAVRALVEADFHVLVADSSGANERVVNEVLAACPGATKLSSRDPESIVAEAWKLFGRVDAIVSNDHYPAAREHTSDASLESLRLTFEKLVVEPFALVKAAIPRFQEQGGGNIVMITSSRTHSPIPGGAIPDAARAAENALVRSFAIELAPFKIVVNAVAPNFLYSEAYYPRAVFIDSEQGRNYVSSLVPAGRLGQPEEIGDLIRHLATTESRFLTGAIVDFSGGWPSTGVRPGS